MNRLRHRLAKGDADKAIQMHLNRAASELLEAVRFSSECGDASPLRKRRVERDLRRALSAVEEVGSLDLRFGSDDPDLISEDERNRLARVGAEEVSDA